VTPGVGLESNPHTRGVVVLLIRLSSDTKTLIVPVAMFLSLSTVYLSKVYY
jgi:hypothetical protein